MRIDYLTNWDSNIEQLATAQFEQCGPLTGRDNLEQYKALLRRDITGILQRVGMVPN